MAALPALFTELLLTPNGLPLGDDAEEALAALSRVDLETVALQAVDTLTTGFGNTLVELGVPRNNIPAPLEYAELRNDFGFKQLLDGSRTLSIEDTDSDLTRLCQRAMHAVTARVVGAPAFLALPCFGVDGIFGDEVAAAIEAFQRWQELACTGKFGQVEAQSLSDLLENFRAPTLFIASPPEPEALPSSAAGRVVEVARSIANATEEPFKLRMDGRTFRYLSTDFAVAPPGKGNRLLRAPHGVAYSIREGHGYWKCNIFGGIVLALADLPVPTFRAGRFRHYPRAERFGGKLANKRGWQLIRHLDHRNPEDRDFPLVGESQDSEIRDLLNRSLPGDMLFVDHPGKPGEDGGHTRICVESVLPEERERDAAPMWAQASRESAVLRRDGMSKLAGGTEIQFWLLRFTG